MWRCSDHGQLRKDGQPQVNKLAVTGQFAPQAFYKHSQAIIAGDICKMKVAGRRVYVGFAGEAYSPWKHNATRGSTAGVWLDSGTTVLRSEISSDGQRHYHPDHLRDFIPKTVRFDVALRCETISNVPQIQFNEDGVWHDLGTQRMAVKLSTSRVAAEHCTAKSHSWYPCLALWAGESMTEMRVSRGVDGQPKGNNGDEKAGSAVTAVLDPVLEQSAVEV